MSRPTTAFFDLPRPNTVFLLSNEMVPAASYWSGADDRKADTKPSHPNSGTEARKTNVRAGGLPTGAYSSVVQLQKRQWPDDTPTVSLIGGWGPAVNRRSGNEFGWTAGAGTGVRERLTVPRNA